MAPGGMSWLRSIRELDIFLAGISLGVGAPDCYGTSKGRDAMAEAIAQALGEPIAWTKEPSLGIEPNLTEPGWMVVDDMVRRLIGTGYDEWRQQYQDATGKAWPTWPGRTYAYPPSIHEKAPKRWQDEREPPQATNDTTEHLCAACRDGTPIRGVRAYCSRCQTELYFG